MIYIITNKAVMFHQISWLTFFIAFAIVAGIYYIVITPLFFGKYLKRLLKRGNNDSSDRQISGNENPSSVSDYFTYERLRDEITAYLEGEEEETAKSDILFSVLSIIKKNPPLQDERFQGAMSKEIRRLYNEKYNDSLTEEELVSLWRA